MLNPILAQALGYARAGIPIFPVGPDKKPVTPHGFKDATTDEAIIRGWFDEPGYNLALEPEQAGWCVVDLDTEGRGIEHWDILCRDHEAFDTYTVRTPSGGLHLYFEGSLPPKVRIASGVDTRGQRSYVVVPPSTGYRFVGGFMAPLPQWVADLAGAKEREPREAPDDIEWDTPNAITMARSAIAKHGPIGPDDPGDDYALACYILDRGVSVDRGVELWVEAGSDEDWARLKFKNAWDFRQNDAGSDVPPTGADTYADYQPPKDAYERFRLYTAAEGASRPALTFWDKDRFFPRSEDGAVVVIYGAPGSHKTNLTLSMMLELMCSRAAKVVYAAGEGAHGVETLRIPAHCASAGINPADLTNWRLSRAVPLFASSEDTLAFSAAVKPFKPDIIVLDTLATCLTGLDESGSIAGSMMTDNGAAGRIKRDSKALVLIIGHEGKDASKGIRGNSGLHGNNDGEIRVQHHPSGALRVTLERSRDGRDGYSRYWKVAPKGNDAGREDFVPRDVPTPVRIDRAAYEALVKESAVRSVLEDDVREALTKHGAIDHAHGLSDRELAEVLIGDKPVQSDAELRAEWETKVEHLKKKLHNAQQTWGKTTGESRSPIGGTGLQWRWFLAD